MRTTTNLLWLLVSLVPLAYSWQCSTPCPVRLPLSSSSSRRYTFSSSEDNGRWPLPEDFDTTDNDNGRLSDEELEATLTEWDILKPQFNTIHLTGRIGSTPEPKFFDDGKVVVSVSLATKRKYHYMERKYLNLQNGDEETDWYTLEIWGPTAEFVSKFVEKGMRVGVIGSLQEDQWTDKETGELRNRIKIIVRDFDILESRAESDLRRSGGGSSQRNNNNNDYGGSSSGSGGKGGGRDFSSSPAGTGGFFDN
jgi:single-strand DNA-binding protein